MMGGLAVGSAKTPSAFRPKTVARGFEWCHFRSLAGPIPRMVDRGRGEGDGFFLARGGRGD
jgi:hypothetical protein